jgi:hypothetical protein
MKCENGFYAQNFIPNVGLTEGRGSSKRPSNQYACHLLSLKGQPCGNMSKTRKTSHLSVERHAVIPATSVAALRRLSSLLEYTYRHRSSIPDDPGPGSQTCMSLAKICRPSAVDDIGGPLGLCRRNLLRDTPSRATVGQMTGNTVLPLTKGSSSHG